MITSLSPGTVLQERYRILHEVGRGGMGFVYLVEAIRLHRNLALKEMYDSFVDPQERERAVKQFSNEATTLANLDHPGIPRVFDSFEEGGRHYLVMEFVEGKTLEWVVRETPQYINEQEAISWLEQILDVLEYLHSRPEPVVIRDLKPANIMLSSDGKIKIVDFGIAKIFSLSDRTVTTIKGSGSAGFAPPEQYGSGHTDPRSDFYALGVTFYYILTKVVLPDSVDRMLQGGPSYPPSHYNPLVSPKVDALIMKMIEIQPSARFQNVQEIRAALQSTVPVEVTRAGIPHTDSNLPQTSLRLRSVDLPEGWNKPRKEAARSTSSPVDTPKPISFITPSMLSSATTSDTRSRGKADSLRVSPMLMGLIGTIVLLVLMLTLLWPHLEKLSERLTPKPVPTSICGSWEIKEKKSDENSLVLVIDLNKGNLLRLTSDGNSVKTATLEQEIEGQRSNIKLDPGELDVAVLETLLEKDPVEVSLNVGPSGDFGGFFDSLEARFSESWKASVSKKDRSTYLVPKSERPVKIGLNVDKGRITKASLKLCRIKKSIELDPDGRRFAWNIQEGDIGKIDLRLPAKGNARGKIQSLKVEVTEKGTVTKMNADSVLIKTERGHEMEMAFKKNGEISSLKTTGSDGEEIILKHSGLKKPKDLSKNSKVRLTYSMDGAKEFKIKVLSFEVTEATPASSYAPPAPTYYQGPSAPPRSAPVRPYRPPISRPQGGSSGGGDSLTNEPIKY